MGRLYFDNDMVGRADYLLTGAMDTAGVHTDLVPAGSLDNRGSVCIDPYVERTLCALYTERNHPVKGVPRDHIVVAADDNGRRTVHLHYRNKSDC
jgi:hypothetical protein